jgi:hypothetical protein
MQIKTPLIERRFYLRNLNDQASVVPSAVVLKPPST